MDQNKNNCVEGCDLPSTPNDIKVLICQLKREIERLMQTTNAKLLCHDRKNCGAMQIYKRQLRKYITLHD